MPKRPGRLGFQDTEVTSRTLRDRVVGSAAQFRSYIGSPFLHRGMARCFPGAVPWPHCQHRCAFWWKSARLCAKPRQRNLSLEPCWEVHSPGRMYSGQGLGGRCAQLPCGSWHGRCRQYTLPAGQPVASWCENQTQEDYKPKRLLPHPKPPAPT